MILKGNQRGGGQTLAAHLMNEYTNGRVEIAELDGAVAPDLSGAFAEWYAQSKATKGKKYLFSLSINPDEQQRRLTREEYIEFADRIGKKLKLDGQPRAIVMHEKKDEHGILREHVHVVWSRTDTDQQKFINLPDYKLKLRAVTREFAKDHGLELPTGMRKDGLKDRFDRAKEKSNLADKQKEERSGIKKLDVMQSVTDAWNTTRTAEDFVRVLAGKDYFLARGDKRGYVVVDLAGEIHSLNRQIKGVKAAAIKDRLKSMPAAALAGVEKAQAYAKQIREQRLAAQREPAQIKARTPDERRTDLRQQHAQRRAVLDAQLAKITQRHATDTGRLAIAHATANAEIRAKRGKSKPTGLAGFLLRITAFGKIAEFRHKREDKDRATLQRAEATALQRRQDAERRDNTRARSAVVRVERREWRSLEIAIHREEFQKIAAPATDRDKGGGKGAGRPPDKDHPPLTPEFAKAAAQPAGPAPAKAAPKKTGSLRDLFNRGGRKDAPARPPAKPDIEKQEPKTPAREDTLRADFEAAANNQAPEPQKPLEPVADDKGLAPAFRRAAEKKDLDRAIDPTDPGREKHYRRPVPDTSVRR